MAEPVSMGAIAAMAGSGLLGKLLEMQLAKEMAARQRKQQLEDAARQRIEDQRNQMVQITSQSGDRDQSALQNLIGVFARAAR